MNTRIHAYLMGLLALAIILAILASGWWLLGRMAVGSYRHALNYQENDKDSLWETVRAGCAHMKPLKIWVNEDDPHYVPDPRASSDDIYRYLVFDAAILDDERCLGAVVQAARSARYSVQVVITRDGREAENLYFRK